MEEVKGGGAPGIQRLPTVSVARKPGRCFEIAVRAEPTPAHRSADPPIRRSTAMASFATQLALLADAAKSFDGSLVAIRSAARLLAAAAPDTFAKPDRARSMRAVEVLLLAKLAEPPPSLDEERRQAVLDLALLILSFRGGRLGESSAPRLSPPPTHPPPPSTHTHQTADPLPPPNTTPAPAPPPESTTLKAHLSAALLANGVSNQQLLPAVAQADDAQKQRHHFVLALLAEDAQSDAVRVDFFARLVATLQLTAPNAPALAPLIAFLLLSCAEAPLFPGLLFNHEIGTLRAHTQPSCTTQPPQQDRPVPPPQHRTPLPYHPSNLAAASPQRRLVTASPRHASAYLMPPPHACQPTTQARGASTTPHPPPASWPSSRSASGSSWWLLSFPLARPPPSARARRHRHRHATALCLIRPDP